VTQQFSLFKNFFRLRKIIAPSLLVLTGNVQADDTINITIDSAKAGPEINRHIFGQFAEHLGRGIYEGVWVGPDSAIPNTRGIRNDVVAALKALKVPNVRWPGGCFADEYHWRNGIGKPEERRVQINASWAGRSEPNTFGTHEYFDFLEQIGADAFISANVGSGTVKEAADWLEYLTAKNSALADERAKNGRAEPYEVAFWGIGNETWGCGGPLTAEEYLPELKKYSNFSTNYNDKIPTTQVAVGPDGDGYGEYAEVVMKAWSTKSWAWDIGALSLHRYTRNGWPPNIASIEFGEVEYASVIKETLGMDQFISQNIAIMDKYDPARKVGIMVDEWGTWYAPAKGTDPGYLEQGNSQRDAIIAALNFNIFVRHAERVRGANVAQMVNVLQAMILTDNEKMVLTPTYHAFHLYVPFQNATRLSLKYKESEYKHKNIRLPRIDAIAARGQDGRIWLAVTNIDPNRAARVNIALAQGAIAKAEGQSLGAPAVDTVNSFEKPDAVVPKPVRASQPDNKSGNKVQLSLAPHSVTVIAIDEQQ
jgi:alpha-N-arabinofuranosidase